MESRQRIDLLLCLGRSFAPVGGQRRVLLIAPRRSGKTHFLRNHVAHLPRKKTVYLTPYKHLLEESGMPNSFCTGDCYYNLIEKRVLREKIQECQILYLDEALFAPDDALDFLLSLDIPNVIAISSPLSNNEEQIEKIGKFLGFDIMDAPLHLCETPKDECTNRLGKPAEL